MIEQYINFITTQLIKDSFRVQFEYGWNFLLIPYVYWLIFFIFKYAILTSPFWIPINMIKPTINNIILKNKKQI